MPSLDTARTPWNNPRLAFSSPVSSRILIPGLVSVSHCLRLSLNHFNHWLLNLPSLKSQSTTAFNPQSSSPVQDQWYAKRLSTHTPGRFSRSKENLLWNWIPGLAQAIAENRYSEYMNRFFQVWFSRHPVARRPRMKESTYERHVFERKQVSYPMSSSASDLHYGFKIIIHELMGRLRIWRFQREQYGNSPVCTTPSFSVSSSITVSGPISGSAVLQGSGSDGENVAPVSVSTPSDAGANEGVTSNVVPTAGQTDDAQPKCSVLASNKHLRNHILHCVENNTCYPPALQSCYRNPRLILLFRQVSAIDTCLVELQKELPKYGVQSSDNMPFRKLTASRDEFIAVLEKLLISLLMPGPSILFSSGFLHTAVRYTWLNVQSTRITQFFVTPASYLNGNWCADIQEAEAQGFHLRTSIRTRDPAKESAIDSRTLQTRKLKKAVSGGFKVVSSRGISGASIPNIPVNDPRSTEEILDSYYTVSDSYGWDEAYVDDLVDKNLSPVGEDPESNEASQQKSGSKGDPVLQQWTDEIDKFLRILLTLEGRGHEFREACLGSGAPSPRVCGKDALFRCLGCDNGPLMCGECMVDCHASHPLHRIEKWNGTHFERSSLKSLGLRIQLGHPPGGECLVKAKAYKDDFIVIDSDMVHEVALDYCACGYTSKDQVEQLLDRRLYPATITNPKTAATFRCLEVFEVLQYESKLSAFEFWKTISRLTDNTGLNTVKDRYPSLLRMVHEWRHLKLLKRAGKGHDLGGVASTGEGECTLLCPACPHPGINMPDGWEREPEATRYIHALNIGLDANYRLRRKDVSNDDADPGLSKGFAYFVNDKPFREKLVDHEADREPKSTCSRHDAVNLADIRPGQGYAATGVATVECIRHNMKRPSAVCDLQKGERYFNMDYIFISSLVLFGLTLLKSFIISYDIACQWSILLFSRLTKINPEAPVLKPDSETRFVVPKFHLPAHIPACQTRFAFMFTRGAGLGDGEAPERGWADSNPLGPSTREMGPGTRRDTIDYHFGNYNWLRFIDMGNSLWKKMNTAASGVAECIVSHKDFEKGLEPGQVASWWSSVTAWENDPQALNPFDMTISTPSQSAVRKALANEEEANRSNKKAFTLTHDMSPSQLVAKGIDLESEMELTRVKLKSNAIIRKVEAWYRIIQVEIPSTILLREKNASNTSKTIKAYDLPLWLPSEIGKKAPFPLPLGEIEYRLREAQALDALTTIRRNLQRRVTVWDLKDRWLRGQGANTKALNLLSTLQQKIKSAKEEYDQARSAILSLAPILGKTNAEKVYLVLKDSDLVPLSAESVTAPSKGQTKHTGASWIWKHPGANNDNLTAYEEESEHPSSGPLSSLTSHRSARKIEWAKSRARSHRYQEEILIVKEEMMRTLRFLLWKEGQWALRAGALAGAGQVLTPEHSEGVRAYAARQGSMCRAFYDSFRTKWSKVGELIDRTKREVENPDLIFKRKEEEAKKLLKHTPINRRVKQTKATVK
ncbi:hypothetical protein NMY22_g526 [Coprinellus aureogranulatus]|nr:hypothetical protein NMY22_g526 [Coprinellus aureogranulatus]